MCVTLLLGEQGCAYLGVRVLGLEGLGLRDLQGGEWLGWVLGVERVSFPHVIFCDINKDCRFKVTRW